MFTPKPKRFLLIAREHETDVVQFVNITGAKDVDEAYEAAERVCPAIANVDDIEIIPIDDDIEHNAYKIRAETSDGEKKLVVTAKTEERARELATEAFNQAGLLIKDMRIEMHFYPVLNEAVGTIEDFVPIPSASTFALPTR